MSDHNDLQIESFGAWVLAAHLATGVVPNTTPPQQTAVVSVNRAEVLNAALSLLRQRGGIDLHNLDVRTIDRKPPQVSPNAEAFIFDGKPPLYVATYSDVYKSAQRGSQDALIKLASIIAHEATHIEGKGEKEAYEQQLGAPRRMGAPSNIIDGVTRARNSVLKQR